MRCLFYCGRIYSIKFKIFHKFQFCLKFLKKKKKKSNKCVNNNIKLPCTNFTNVIFLSKKVARSQLVDDRLTRKKKNFFFFLGGWGVGGGGGLGEGFLDQQQISLKETKTQKNFNRAFIQKTILTTTYWDFWEKWL